ncbi:MAG: histidine kinase N-terminal 7TM domain-containing protein [Bacteroidales bacterium]
MDLYTFTVYTGIYIFSLFISGLVFFIAWKKRKIPTSKIISIMMLSVTLWTLAGVFEVSAIPVPLKIFWSKMEYLGGTATPVLLFIFTLVYSKNEKWINPRNVILLFFIPILVVILVFTNEYHGLIWKGFQQGPEGTNSLIYYHGKAFWFFYIFYSYLLLLASTVLLLRTSASLPSVLGLQSFFIILALLFPWGASFLYITGINPIPGLELTRVSFVFTGLILAFAIIRLKLLELSPIARTTLIDNMNDGVIVLDDLVRIVDINASAGNLIMDNSDRIFGKSIHEIQWKSDSLKNYLLSDSSNRIEIISHSPVFSCLEIIKTPLSSEKQKVFGYLVVIHDITVTKKLESSLIENTKKLEEANADKDKFLKLLSHDLRNPLGTLLGLSEVLHHEFDDLPDQKRRSVISSIYSASEQTYLLVEGLLEWARQNTGQLVYHPEPLNIKEVIHDVTLLFMQQASLKNITISEMVPSPFHVVSDKNMLKTVLRNLMSNAIKFTPTGGSVIITGNNPGSDIPGKQQVSISVQDTGAGIPKENLKQLFQYNYKYSEKGTAGEKGSGLGLLLCKELLQKNGGTISVVSEVGKGSTFTITLPYANE